MKLPMTRVGRKMAKHVEAPFSPSARMQSHSGSIHSPQRMRKIIMNEWKKSLKFHLKSENDKPLVPVFPGLTNIFRYSHRREARPTWAPDPGKTSPPRSPSRRAACQSRRICKSQWRARASDYQEHQSSRWWCLAGPSSWSRTGPTLKRVTEGREINLWSILFAFCGLQKSQRTNRRPRRTLRPSTSSKIMSNRLADTIIKSNEFQPHRK